MRRSFAFLAMLLLGFAFSCRQVSETGTEDKARDTLTRIVGHMEKGQGKQVFLEEMGARAYLPIDTASCDESGRFEMAFHPRETAFYVLRYGASAYVTLLIEPGEQIQFKGNWDQAHAYQVTGSPGSLLLHKLHVEHRQTLDALGEISTEIRDLSSSEQFSAIKPRLDQRFDSTTRAFHDFSLDFIRENQHSPAILIALYNLYGQNLPVFDPEKDLQVYKLVDSVLRISYPDMEAVQLLHSQITEAEQWKMERERSRGLKKGEPAPDFVSTRPDGSLLSLSELKGSWLILSFWAAWSPPSREENTWIRQAMDLYGSSGLRILQVSLDRDRELWTSAIAADKLDWEHVSDLQGWDSPVSGIYRISRIPSILLIDPNGRIVETDVSGEQLLRTLESRINK